MAGAPLLLSAQETWRSTLYPEDWTPAFRDGQGRFLHDFSYAGYHYGLEEPPQVEGPVYDVTTAPYNADRTGTQDATAAIQAAIDAAGQAGGGVVLLPAGTYRVAPRQGHTEALRIRDDNVILRGEGPGKTFLFNDSTQMRGRNVLRLEPTDRFDWHKEGDGIPFSPLAQDAPNQATEVTVTDTTPFAKGDLVILRSDLTQRFIDSVGMNGKWQPAGPNSPNRTLMFCRRIVGVDPATKTLRLDVPLRYPLHTADLARVVKVPGRMLTGVGLEDFSLGMKQHPGTGLAEEDWNKDGTAGYDIHGSTAILVEAAENCWLRGVHTYAPSGNDPDVHILSNTLRLSRSRLVTVTGCEFRFTQYKGGGGNGYHYTHQGQENLIIHCVAEGGRHNYDFGTMRCSGNVITGCLSKDGLHASDFHMFLSMSNLFDTMTCDGDFLEARAYRPWGGNPVHGVTSTQSVFWNTNGLRYGKERRAIVWSEQVDDGYVIGTRGPDHNVDSNDFVEGVGRGDTLRPASLYQDQLQRRKAGRP